MICFLQIKKLLEKDLTPDGGLGYKEGEREAFVYSG